jgi:RNA polymerase sigma-70 factor (ECF subfamily)
VTGAAETYRELRPLLFSLAYRMLGSVAEAEDVVQDAFVRYARAVEERAADVQSPRAYLAATTTRLAIDRLRAAQARREQYVGTWLPEPLPTDELGDAERQLETADTLSMAFLLLLERLSPLERAVFLLHDVFDYGYDEIAEIVGRSEAACRQLASRARRHLDEARPRFEASREERDKLARRFMAAADEGDMESLLELLAADVVVYGDGGGKAPQWSQPIYGRDRVSRLLVGTLAQAREFGVTHRWTHLNGQPGVIFLTSDGSITNVWEIDVADGVVQAVRSVINPDKLGHLGPVADVRGMLRGRRGE